MVFARSARVFIKVLKDLVNVTTRFSIDIKVLKDLKRRLLTLAIAGDRPPRYGSIETRRALLLFDKMLSNVVSYG